MCTPNNLSICFQQLSHNMITISSHTAVSFLLISNQTSSPHHHMSFVIQTRLHLHPLSFSSSSLMLSQHISEWKTAFCDLLLPSIHSCILAPPSLSLHSHPAHYRQTGRHVLAPVPQRSDGWQQWRHKSQNGSHPPLSRPSPGASCISAQPILMHVFLQQIGQFT